jgi:lysophospholipase L1-like esterase
VTGTQSTPRFGRARAIAANVAMALAAFVLALGLAEVAVRLLAPQQLIIIRPDLWMPADTVGWLHRPNVSVKMNTGERTVTIHTDRDGFRVGAEGRREAPVQVLLLGDSFMEALQVEHEETVASLLERELAVRLSTDVAVRNAGVSGWDPDQYFLRARDLTGRDDFDLVIVALFVGNDAIPVRRDYLPPRAPVQRHQARLPRTLRRGELMAAWILPLNDYLEVRSHAYILLKNQLATLRKRVGLTADHFPVEFFRAEAESHRWRLSAEVSRDLAAEVATHGAPTLFVLIPASFQVYPRSFQEYVRGFGIDSTAVDLDQPNRLLHQELIALDLCVFDALPAFRAAATGAPRLFGSVDPHLSAAGHRTLAQVMVPHAGALIGGSRSTPANPGAGTCAPTAQRGAAGAPATSR